MWNEGDYEEKFNQMEFTPDGRRAGTLSEEGLTIRDAATGKAERTLPREGHRLPLHAPGAGQAHACL